MATASQFRHEDVSAVPRGFKVRTVTHPSGHKVRIAFPSGPRRKGAGKLISILHPQRENPRTCINQGVVALLLATPIEELLAAKALSHQPSAISNPGRKGKKINPVDEMRNLAEALARRWGLRPGPVHKWLLKEYSSYKDALWATASQKQVPDSFWSLRDNPKEKTREQVEAMQAKAVRFLRDVVGDSDKADEIEGLSVVEYAERKKISLTNPRAKAKGKGQKAKGKKRNRVRTIRNRKSKIQNRKRRKNQSASGGEEAKAAGLYKTFHGKEPKEVLEFQKDIIRRKDYAALGKLIEMQLPEIRTAIDFAADNVILASNADGTQLYVIGGNQNIDGLLDKTDDGSKDFLDLGPLKKIIYRARKDFDRFEEIDYVHKMGEKGHAKPRVFYDRPDHQLYIAGGEYQVKREGIVN